MENLNQVEHLRKQSSIKNFWWIIIVPVILGIISAFIEILLFPTFVITLLIFIVWGIKKENIREELFKPEVYGMTAKIDDYKNMQNSIYARIGRHLIRGYIELGISLIVMTIITYTLINRLSTGSFLYSAVELTVIILLISFIFVVSFFFAFLSIPQKTLNQIAANKVQFLTLGV